LALLYGAVAAIRNGLFAVGWKRVRKLSVPVVSIGNLTVGGTGKTPTVAWLCQLAKQAGKVPGVLARGYGRAPGAELNDEGTLLQRRMPWLLQEQDPDRVAAGERLVAKGANFIVLDDGFQHRRLHRDLDVVCLDARLPFGNGYCLPAGDLREFRSGLRRASCLLLTRAGSLEPQQLQQRCERLRQIAGKNLPIYAAEHQPSDLVCQPAGTVEPATALQSRRVVLLSAIARPESFRVTVLALGAEVVGEIVHRDHHRFRQAEVDAAVAKAKAANAILVTTEKDDARLDAFDLVRYVLRVDMHFLDTEPRPEEFLL
jgi:tetraacyldisaccharide 4'-kinase